MCGRLGESGEEALGVPRVLTKNVWVLAKLSGTHLSVPGGIFEGLPCF